MQEIKLDVHVREEKGTKDIRVLRRQNFIPAIVYGGKRSPTSIKVDRRSFEHIARLHRGENVVFHLNVLQDKKKLRDYSAIVRELQLHPVHETVEHIDFKRISLKEKIEVKVQIHAKGESVGVKKDGGAVDHPLWELEVICLPTNIPQHIDVDITNMKIGDAVHVKDLVLPEGVETKHDPETIVLSIVPPMKEVEEEPAEAPTEPEVTKEKKEGEEGEAKPEDKKGEAKKPDAKKGEEKKPEAKKGEAKKPDEKKAS